MTTAGHRPRLPVYLIELARRAGMSFEQVRVALDVSYSHLKHAEKRLGRKLRAVVVAIRADADEGNGARLIAIGGSEGILDAILDVGVEDRRRNMQSREKRFAHADLVVGRGADSSGAGSIEQKSANWRVGASGSVLSTIALAAVFG